VKLQSSKKLAAFPKQIYLRWFLYRKTSYACATMKLKRLIVLPL